MKKYNLSNIMKKAWEMRRSYNCRSLTFGQCLKRAWEEAKKELAESEVIAEIKEFKNGMVVYMDGIRFQLSRWTKAGYDRVYINDGTRKGAGYIDIVNHEVCFCGHSSSKLGKIILNKFFAA